MGNATSSALRADDLGTPAPDAGEGHLDDGPGFGSLANLGGPRKFKKKPVLVLDPEELEKAHMMFQDASAELLGEEVERAEKAKPILGLAPIDDEDATPEDMGASDDGEAGEDDEAIPSAEEVLRMTESRAPVDPDMQAAQDEYIAQQLESLDVDHRIFPSLPLRSEEEIAAEEEAERLAAAAQAREAEEEQSAAEEPVELPPSSIELAYEPLEPRPAPRAHAFPVNPLPEPEAEIEPLPEPPAKPETEAMAAAPEALDPFGTAPFLDFPTQPVQFAYPAEPVEDAVVEQPVEVAEEVEDHVEPVQAEDLSAPIAPEPEPEPELPPTPAPELELELEDDWDEDGPLGLDPVPQPMGEVDTFDEAEPEPEAHSNSTEIDDEPVDGYAFMYAHNPRARTLQALADGESNSLRAKLIKEREAAMEELGLEERKDSIWARFTAWLRGLFVR